MATSSTPKPAPLAVLQEKSVKQVLKDTPVSVANKRSDEYKPTKTDGIKIRGCGAATKGTTARGPMG
jgi:hypothetical protein